MNLGEQIKQARKQKGWTQEQLAAKFKFSPQTISYWEKGTSEPDLETCGKLSRLLGIPAEVFLGLEERMDKSKVVYHDRMFSEEHMYTFVKSAASTSHMEDTLKALPLMKEMHAGKFRKNTRVGGEQIPYIYHPLMIACHALAMGLKDDTLIAAILLHDVVEDSPVTADDLKARGFSEAVVSTVDAVTKKGAAKAHDSKALAAYYAEIAQHPYACMVKVLDRCNNLSCMALGFDEQHMVDYIVEAETYILPLLDKIKDEVPEYHDAAFLIKYQMLSVMETVKRLV